MSNSNKNVNEPSERKRQLQQTKYSLSKLGQKGTPTVNIVFFID